MSDILDEALLLYAAGHDVILTDSAKNPGIVPDWGNYQWTPAKLVDVYRRRANCQVALRLYPVIDVEIDAPDGDAAFMAEATAQLYALGGEVRTATWKSRRGQHWLFEVDDAQRAELEALKSPAVVKLDKLEVRMGVGKASQSLIPPSITDGVRRQWVVPIDEGIAPLPAAMFDAIVALVREKQKPKVAPPIEEDVLERPGDIFNDRTSWDELLTPYGWTAAGEVEDGVRHWIRPGKTEGISATTGFCKTDSRPDCFYSFSTAPEIEPLESQKAYSKFEAFTMLEFGGDFNASTQELVRRGFTPNYDEYDEFADFVSALDSPPPPKPPRVDTSFPDFIYDNPIGRYVLANDPHTEADKEAVLLQSWELFGNFIGKGVTFHLNNSVQYANGFLAVVGDTALARKGTSLQDAMAPYRAEDVDLETYVTQRIRGGISSGEGIINHVADTPGFIDGRLMIPIQEFHRLMAVVNRTDSTLSSILREAYDGGTLAVTTRTNPLVATRGHVSMIIHTTEAEFGQCVKPIDFLNGLLNRIVYVNARSEKVLPNPGRVNPDELERLSQHLLRCREWAENGEDGRELYWSEEAAQLWTEFYAASRQTTSDEMGDAILVRAPVHVIKFAMRHAALDMSEAIQRRHLECAIAIWNHCMSAAKRLAAGQNPYSDDRERVRSAIADSGAMTKTEVMKLFNNHKSAKDVDDLLSYLVGAKLVQTKKQKRNNRPVLVWVPTEK